MPKDQKPWLSDTVVAAATMSNLRIQLDELFQKGYRLVGQIYSIETSLPNGGRTMTIVANLIKPDETTTGNISP